MIEYVVLLIWHIKTIYRPCVSVSSAINLKAIVSLINTPIFLGRELEVNM